MTLYIKLAQSLRMLLNASNLGYKSAFYVTYGKYKGHNDKKCIRVASRKCCELQLSWEKKRLALAAIR